MNYYEKNMAFFREKDPELVEALEEYQVKQTDLKVEVSEGKFGSPVMLCEKDGKSYYFSSPFDGEGTYEEAWMEQFDSPDYEGVLFCFGMARINYLRKFKEEKKDYMLLVYEPSVEIFRALLEWTDLTFLDEKDILLIKGLNDEEWYAVTYTVSHKEMAENSNYVCMPNYEKIFGADYIDFTDGIKKILKGKAMDIGVALRFSEEMTRNLRNNIKDIIRSSDLNALIENLPKGKPGIVVSAGPSLNNNIDELKNAVGKALIVATDTALKPLITHGIMPDAFVTVDPSKPLVLFEKEEVRDIPMILLENGNSEVVEKHRGKKFFSLMWQGFCKHIYERYEKPIPWLETGGSVANNVYSFLQFVGCNPIIFVGQDLAYTNKKSHADGTFKEEMDDVNTEESKYIEIEDIYGNTTYTTADFKHYLEWFEEKIEEHPEIKAIDATEGGAKIHGAELMTLKEAVAAYCTEEFDVSHYFEEASDVFNAEERKEVEEYLLSTPKMLDDIKRKAKRGKQSYEDMIFRIRRNEWGRELKSSLKKVGKLTDFLDNDETMMLVKPILVDYDHVYKQKVKKIDVNSEEGLLEMLESGKEYMEKVIETVDLLKDDFVAMTEKVKEMQKEEKEMQKA